MNKIRILTLFICATLTQAAELPFQPHEIEKKSDWHQIEDNEIVIEGSTKWKFTIGHDRLVYVIVNKGEKALSISEQKVTIYNRYGFVLAIYGTESTHVDVGGVRTKQDYENFYPLDIIFQHSEIEAPSDWGIATWLEIKAKKNN